MILACRIAQTPARPNLFSVTRPLSGTPPTTTTSPALGLPMLNPGTRLPIHNPHPPTSRVSAMTWTSDPGGL